MGYSGTLANAFAMGLFSSQVVFVGLLVPTKMEKKHTAVHLIERRKKEKILALTVILLY